MRVGLCFSGHVRNFDKCYDNIYHNLITPLMVAGFQVDLFGCFWDCIGHRSTGWSGTDTVLMNFIHGIQWRSLTFKSFDREYFTEKYYSNQWTTRPHLSCKETSGDAVSMWYMAYNCFKMLQEYSTLYNFKYDIVVRLRPDLLFDEVININEVRDAIDNNILYIPRWRGKYYEVSHGITDYFAFSTYSIMSLYYNIYPNIDDYLRDNNVIHTGEGFLLHQTKNLLIKRIAMGFHIKRLHYDENVMI